ncbi:hypothetical protein [Actinoplanes sp. NPDC051851]|uniref:hypothetical protein n=1 Tax=Actinoplanes sp. NPDC051851 TaxID=3154753 RepID=UPI00344844C9
MPVLIGLAAALLVAVIGVGVLLVRDDEPSTPAVIAGPATAPATEVTTEQVSDPATAVTTASVTTPATPTPREQADVIDRLLDESTASRARLNRAIDRVKRCTQLGAALADMRAVGDERRGQIAAAEAADVSAIGGGSLRSTLISAFQSSLEADQQFVAWAEPAVTGSCDDTASRSAAWEKAQAYSRQAQTYKKRFVAIWNQVAVPLGFPKRSTTDI